MAIVYKLIERIFYLTFVKRKIVITVYTNIQQVMYSILIHILDFNKKIRKKHNYLINFKEFQKLIFLLKCLTQIKNS